MTDKIVSIITPCYNSSKYIKDTYESVLSQTHSNWEWIVTDDCSSDNTYSLLLELSKLDSRIKVFSNEVNSGAAVARNNSLNNAVGNYIAFLDSDDLWLPTKLEEQLYFMGDDVDFCFTPFYLIDPNGSLSGKVVDKNKTGVFNYHDMLKKKATLGCSTVMLRRAAFSTIQMPLIRTGQDYALWLSLLKRCSYAKILPKPLTKYRILPNSISRNKFKKAIRQWEIYRKIEKLEIGYSMVCFLFYAWRAVFRK